VFRRIAAPAAVLVALAGCGGAKSDRSQVTSVVRSYFAALATGNGKELCSLLTGTAKQQLVRSGAALSVLTHSSNSLSCADDVKSVSEILGSDQVAELRKVKLTVASLTRATARVRAKVQKGHTATVPLEKTAAGWLVSTADLRSAAGEPVSVMCWGEEPMPQQRPAQCDIFGEPEDDAHLVRLGDARWSGWGSAETTAPVQVLGNHQGEMPVAARVTLSEPQPRCKGELFYTRLHLVRAGEASAPFDLRLSGACHSISLNIEPGE
jgi:hypothetical protein